jgi:carboxymethylenebutenolidase
VPDLYNGKSTIDAEEAHHLSENLDWVKSTEDLTLLVEDLRAGHPTRKIGIIGFCMFVSTNR